MAWVPLLRPAVVNVAWPPEVRGTGAPTSAPSTLNCTEPVGTSVEKLTFFTDPVKVTDCPTVDGFFDDVTVVDVLFGLMTCVIVRLLVTKFPFVPVKTASTR